MLYYPILPAHARILIAAFDLGSIAEIIDILAMMETGDPFAKQSNHEAADLARQQFVHRDGDHLTYLQVLRAALEAEQRRKTDPGSPKLHAWCKDHSLNHRAVSEAISIRDQLRKLVAQDGQSADVSAGDDAAPVLKALLYGLSQYVAVITPTKTYKQFGSGQVGPKECRRCVPDLILSMQAIKIHPSSVLAGKAVAAFLFDELVSIVACTSPPCIQLTCIDRPPHRKSRPTSMPATALPSTRTG